MIHIMKRYIFLALIAAITGSAAKAQNESLPSRSMTIEGAYNPSVTEAGKIMPLPEKTRTVRQPASVNYLTSPNPVRNLERSPMEVFGIITDGVEPKRVTGLLRLGYGMRNLNEGLFDLGWDITEIDHLNLSGSMDGWNSKPDGDWKSMMFNSKVAADYSHRFNDRVSMGLSTYFGYSRFNYMPGRSMTPAIDDASNLFQNTKEGSLSGCISSVSRIGVAFYIAGGGEWLIRDGLDLNGTVRCNKEGIVRLSAGFDKPLENGSFGVGYRQKTKVYRWWGLYGCEYSGFTAFTLTPSWKYESGRLRTNLGLNMDLRTSAGKAILMSPMVTFDYDVSPKFGFQLGATGGLEEYDMRKLAVISPYWSEQERITDGYNVVNVYGGLTFRQGSWLSMSAKAGYRYTVDEVFQTRADSLIVTSVLKPQDASVLYARFDADMQFSDRVQFRMDVTYSDYLGNYPGHKMDLKPAFDANLFGRVNIFRGFDAMLSYRMMAFHRVGGKSMPTVNDISLTADYDLTDWLSLYATVKHLAGGDFYYYAGYRSLKPAVMLGATLRF